MHIFPKMSQSKSNQTMKFGQLIEHNRNELQLFLNQVVKSRILKLIY